MVLCSDHVHTAGNAKFHPKDEAVSALSTPSPDEGVEELGTNRDSMSHPSGSTSRQFEAATSTKSTLRPRLRLVHRPLVPTSSPTTTPDLNAMDVNSDKCGAENISKLNNNAHMNEAHVSDGPMYLVAVQPPSSPDANTAFGLPRVRFYDTILPREFY
jgi:hypothetical protein